MIKIISEIGINHNGDINLAKKMIEESKKAGVDLVKFQKRDIDLVYSKEVLDQFRESPWNLRGKSGENSGNLFNKAVSSKIRLGY